MGEVLDNEYIQKMLGRAKPSLMVANVLNMTLLGMYTTLASMAMYKLSRITTLLRRTFWSLVGFTVASGLSYVAFVVGIGGITHSVMFSQLSRRNFNEHCVTIILTSVTLSTVLTDGILTYRCWIIWGRSRWILLPIALLLAEFACFCPQAIYLTTHHIVPPKASAKSALAALSFNLALNVLLASAAVARLLLARRNLRRAAPAMAMGGKHYSEISRLLAGIAIVYVAVWLFTLIYHTDFVAVIVAALVMSVVTVGPLLLLLQMGERARAGASLTPVNLDAVVAHISQLDSEINS